MLIRILLPVQVLKKYLVPTGEEPGLEVSTDHIFEPDVHLSICIANPTCTFRFASGSKSCQPIGDCGNFAEQAFRNCLVERNICYGEIIDVKCRNGNTAGHF
jgi:hypothetical protein